MAAVNEEGYRWKKHRRLTHRDKELVSRRVFFVLENLFGSNAVLRRLEPYVKFIVLLLSDADRNWSARLGIEEIVNCA